MEISDLEARVKQAEPNGLCKVNIVHESGNEGVWVCFATPEDKAAYTRNKGGEQFEVFLMNAALVGRPAWGARLKVTSAGYAARPTIRADEVVKQLIAAVAAGDYPDEHKFPDDDDDDEDEDEEE